MSDVVYCSHTGWQFRHAVHLRRAGTGTSGSGTTVLQKVCTGDLVAVADDTHPDITKHFRIEPWNKSKKNEQLPSWRVGQVLAIASSSSFQKNNSDNRGRNRNSSPTSSTADPFRHCAVVQWLHPMQYIQEHDKKHPDCPLVNRRELQKIQGILRPHFMLWQPPCRQGGSASTESNTNPGKEPEMQCLVDLQSILPAAATLLDCKVFQDRQLPGELAPGCFEFYFHCHFRLPYDRDGQPTECPRDDFWPTGNNQPPTTVTTGWNRFSWSDLFPGDFSRLDQQNKVVSALTASYQSLKHHKPAKERFLVVGEISKSVYPAKPKPPARELSSKRTDKTDSMATVSNDKASKKRKGTVEEPPPTRLKPKKPDVTTSRKSNVRAPLRVVEVKPNVKVTSKKTKEPAQKKIRRASIDHHVMPVSSVSAESTQRRLATRKKGQGSTEAWTTVPPLFVDHFDGIEYFSELEVNPPLESFSMEFLSAAKNHAALTWTVRLGDPVIVHSNVCSGRASYVCSARFGTSRQKISPTHFPFGVPWAVGEVVTIMRHQSADESAEIKLEIRWLYRERELGSKVRRHTEIHDFETEEVCESDHYDEIAPTSLLAPVRLYEEAQSLNDGMNYLQMPVIEFHCQRYWSVARKCLKPVGGLIGRIERGRLLSKVIGRNVALKTALSATKLQVADVLPIDVGNQIWKESFAKVVKKLSLTDASKVAFENPDRLVGREKERKEIESFLMSSLSVEYDVEMKACLFIAGPPGTGKTAVS